MVLSKKISRVLLVLWTRKVLFWQPYEFFAAENRKFFNQGSKKVLKNYLVFQKNFFFSINANRNIGWSFGNLAEKLSTKSWSFFVQCTNMFWKMNSFQKGLFCFKLFLWTRRIRFWQLQRSFYGRKLKTVHSISEKSERARKFFQKEVFSSKISYGNIESNLKKPQKFSRQKSENL